MATIAITGTSTLAYAGLNPDDVPTVVKKVEEATKYKAITKIPVKGNLTGWVMSNGPGKNITVYTPKDNSVVILGNMLDANGVNLTKEYSEQYGVKVDYKKAWNALEKTSVVTQSAKGPVKSSIYVFIDPNCGYCHLAYKALTPYVEKGLEIKWVPVAFLREDSADKAAYLLTQKNKNEALDAINDSFGEDDANVTAEVTSEIKVILSKNSDIMRSVAFEGTPGILYKDKNGTVKGIGGMIKLSQIPEITGLPLIKNTDPALKRFE